MKPSKLIRIAEEILDESRPLGDRVKNAILLRSYMLSLMLNQPLDDSLVEKIKEEQELFPDIIPPFDGSDIIELFEWFKEATKQKKMRDEKYGETQENLSQWARRVALISISILTHLEILTPEETDLGVIGQSVAET